jgi:hypothetical protein
MSGGLLAFNATDLGQELYASTMVPARDTLPKVAHFATQTIANGKVYIATQTTLSVYGLLPDASEKAISMRGLRRRLGEVRAGQR